ncbi:pntA [Symbiodinium natans]|uniref:PntA protein n=1 Tax=Symbiodinium natans TaxID=878477 RepID=A0A812MFJ8_9DINO|nr:pntA [Symbiodinium natans]
MPQKDYAQSSIHEGLESWMENLQSFDHGESAEPDVLHKMTQAAGSLHAGDDESVAGRQSPSEVDQELRKELGDPSVMQRVQDFASNLQLLTKVIQENSLVQQLAIVDPVVAQVINSPEALQKIFSSEVLGMIQQDQNPDQLVLEPVVDSSLAYM